MLELLEGWLRHKSDMVNFEAARVICETKGISSAQLSRSIAGWLKKKSKPSSLLNWLNSSSPAAFPVIPEAGVEVRRHSYSCFPCALSSIQCCNVQCRSGRLDFRPQSKCCYLCNNYIAQSLFHREFVACED
jgi:hypothetical protein